MEKSIESIWNKGFENSNNLQAPKQNDPFKQKSKLIVDKIRKTSVIDNYALFLLAALLGGGFIYSGYTLKGN